MDISRRSFLKGSAAGALLLALSGVGLTTASAAETNSGLKQADQTYECDVLVVGLGASGLMAACGAAAKGANVIAVDAAGAMLGTTNIMTSGAWAVGSKMEMEEDPNPSTVEDAFKYTSFYSSEQNTLRNVFLINYGLQRPQGSKPIAMASLTVTWIGSIILLQEAFE